MLSNVTNSAGVYVLEPIDNNYSTGDGDISVGGCLVYATKGKPFEAMEVHGSTSELTDYFGKPLPKKSEGMEGLRHVQDATGGCTYVQVIRVVDSTYRFPSIAYTLTNNPDAIEKWAAAVEYKMGDLAMQGDKTYLCAEPHTAATSNQPGTAGGADYWLEYTSPVENNAHRYNESLTVGEGSYMLIYPIDGDLSANRSVRISDVDEDAERFVISIYDVDDDGEEYKLESYTVGVSEEDKDDMGLSAFIETVFERESDVFRVSFMDGLTWADVVKSLKAVESTRTKTVAFKFSGGVAGGYPETDDWLKGIELLRNERMPLNLLFAAGIYDQDLIVKLADVADFRHIAFFFDVPGSLRADEAIEWMKSMALVSRHARAYYSPYTATDIYRGGKTLWGVSGAAASAKAKCNKIQNVKATWGVHYSPAGENRGSLTRTGLTALFPDDALTQDVRDKFYDARINPIVTKASGGCAIDDDMTCWNKTNYLRFGWVNDIFDYIDHLFFEAASQMKFEPDGLTKQGLTDLMTTILEDLVTSEALVAPRDSEKDGTSPYILTVKQEAIDHWYVQWDVCPTGCARRIVGQPVVIG